MNIGDKIVIAAKDSNECSGRVFVCLQHNSSFVDRQNLALSPSICLRICLDSDKILMETNRPLYLWNPKGVAILTQLRVGLSKLNFHKFKHNFQETVDPMCPINDGIEDTEHFLLHCYAYEDLRRDPLGAINEVFQPHNILNLSNQTLVQILLYGDGKCTQNQNRNILESTLKFIHTSERFL